MKLDSTREPTPLERFTEAMRHIMAVPKAEVKQRALAERKRRRAAPKNKSR